MPADLPQIERTLPAGDELEISLFGPGRGECVVIHLGNNLWMVVDSCKNPKTKRAIALDYLEEIGVDPKVSVVNVVISHWHSDHIGGAADLVKHCAAADVGYSAALLKKEFLTLMSAFANPSSIVDRNDSRMNEMASIIRCLDARVEDDPNYVLNCMMPAMDGMALYDRTASSIRTEIKALSPSSASFNNALQEFRSMMPADGDQRTVTPSPNENHNAIALWVRFGNCSALLGADLEETVDPYTGWSVIVNSKNRPSGQASIFKVPHHGSATGHSDDVWKHMLGKDAVALCTTFNNSHLPRGSDVARIKSYTDNFFCTTRPIVKPPKRDPAVDRTLSETVKERRVLAGDVGQLQVRLKQNGDWRLGVKPPAVQF